jgi:hypothetical protein
MVTKTASRSLRSTGTELTFLISADTPASVSIAMGDRDESIFICRNDASIGLPGSELFPAASGFGVDVGICFAVSPDRAEEIGGEVSFWA